MWGWVKSSFGGCHWSLDFPEPRKRWLLAFNMSREIFTFTYLRSCARAFGEVRVLSPSQSSWRRKMGTLVLWNQTRIPFFLVSCLSVLWRIDLCSLNWVWGNCESFSCQWTYQHKKKNQSPEDSTALLHVEMALPSKQGLPSSTGWGAGEELARILSPNLEYVQSSLPCPEEAVGLFFLCDGFTALFVVWTVQ